ncbi:L-threonylcarbamoyladenylate synthase, partial [bacterium]
ILNIKKRPKEKLFVIQVYDLYSVNKLCEIDNNKYDKLIRTFWPGPVTFIFKAKDYLKKYYRWQYDTAAVRIPDNKITLEILRKTNIPLIVTSANISGQKIVPNIEEIIKIFENSVDFTVRDNIDYGERVSTIVDLTGDEPKLIRQGVISFEEIKTRAQ